MRIVKMSDEDPETRTLDDVHRYFEHTLPARTPPGKFFVTRGRIAKEDGLIEGEILVFTYQQKVVYIALAASSLCETPRHQVNSKDHEKFFIVDMDTLAHAHGGVEKLEREIWATGLYKERIAQSQGWNRVLEKDDVGLAKIEKVLSNFGWGGA